MVTRQTLVVVTVVAMATLAVVVPAVSAAPTETGGADDGTTTAQVSALQTVTDSQVDAENATDDRTDDESGFGTQVTAFMQSSAAQAEDSVDNGMWESAFERANETERVRMARNRARNLNGRVAELERQNRTLSERYRNGSITYEEYVSEASELSGRMEALEEGVNGTTRAAERAGLNESALDELRTNARNLDGPEVAGVARGLASGDRGPPEAIPGRGPPGEDDTPDEDTERPGGGPPDDVPGNPNAGPNGTVDPANRTDGPQAGNGSNPGNPQTGNGANPGNPQAGDGSNPGNSQAGDGSNGQGGGGDSGNAPGAPGNGNGGPGQGNDDGPGQGDDAPGQNNDAPGQGNDDAPGQSGDDSDDEAGDSDGENDDSDSDAEDSDGDENGDADGDADDTDGESDQEGSGSDADGPSGNGPGNSGQSGGGQGGNNGQGNNGDVLGQRLSALLTTDTLFTR